MSSGKRQLRRALCRIGGNLSHDSEAQAETDNAEQSRRFTEAAREAGVDETKAYNSKRVSANGRPLKACQ